MTRTLLLRGGKLVLISAFFFAHAECSAQEATSDKTTLSPCDKIEHERDTVLRFITISAPNLPKHVRLVERIRTTPLIPVTKNPDVLVDPIRLMPVALFFGIAEQADLEPDLIGVSAIYQTDNPADEIGIYGLFYNDEKAAKRQFEKLAKDKDSPFILKDRLLLYVWKDDGVSDIAFEALRNHLKKTDFKPEQGP